MKDSTLMDTSVFFLLLIAVFFERCQAVCPPSELETEDLPLPSEETFARGYLFR